MSTPTPGPHGQANKHATPSHTGATPRSVPSPALSRQHATSLSAKQPKQLSGSVPMAPSLSQASNTSGGARSGAAAGLGINNAGIKIEGVSPHNQHLGHGLNFASPAGMMLEGMSMGMGTPGIGDPGTGLTGIGGVGMDISLSSMGITMQDRGKRDEDEERRKKLRDVLHKVGGRARARSVNTSGMGRVSDEGVRRVGRWAGFDVEVESKYEAKEWEGNRPIVIAGRNAVLIDLAFKNNMPSKVEVTFNSEEENVLAHAAGAANVLKQDLIAKDGVSLINTRLDDFATNLERLARLDKLSSQHLNCVDAITGLYTSLKKLYEHEKELAKSLFGDTESGRDQKIIRNVLRSRSGRPGMHIGGRVGLSLDYWDETPAGSAVGEKLPHSLEITVEQTDPSNFPPIRISKNWLSDRIHKAKGEGTNPADLISDMTMLDWLEPAPTLVPSKDSNDAMAMDASSKQPEVRFVARLQPPVIMPFNIATQLLQSCGVSPVPIPETLSLYETMILDLPPPARHDLNEVVATSEQKTFVPRPDAIRDVLHTTNLYVPKADYGLSLKEIPFSHPRQIVAILPVLRQWIVFGSVLRSAFQAPMLPTFSAIRQTANQERPKVVPGKLPSGKKLALDALLSGTESEKPSQQDALPIDVMLSTSSPSPTMSLFFPIKDKLCSITCAVGADGQMAVASQDVVDRSVSGIADDSDGMDVDGQVQQVPDATRKMTKALETTGNVGVWVEWIRQRYG